MSNFPRRYLRSLTGRRPSPDFAFTVTDAQTGDTYEPWTNGYAVGYKITRPGGTVEYLYLNPSSDGGGDPEHVANVFVYYGATGCPNRGDMPLHFYDLDPEPQPGETA